MNEAHNITGQLHIRVLNREGEIVEERKVHNRITVNGRGLVAELFARINTVNAISHFGVGKSAQATDDSEPGLKEEVAIASPNLRKALAKMEVPRDENGKLLLPVKVKISGELNFNEPFTNPVELREAGLFNFGTIGTGGKTPSPVPVPPVVKSKAGKIKSGTAELPSETKEVAATATTLPGVMYNRVTFEPIIKTQDFKLQFFWEITF